MFYQIRLYVILLVLLTIGTLYFIPQSFAQQKNAQVKSAQRIMILGDSISAGYGMQLEQGWVQHLQVRLNQQFPKQHLVINASVSGETTAGALARMPKLLKTHRPSIVMIELGGNDGLRGQPPKAIHDNLAKLIQLSQNSGAKVVLLGMKIPPNYGSSYSRAFEQNYVTLSQQYKVSLVPFFMQGIAGQSKYMQKDQIHPNAAAQQILLNNTYPTLKSML